MITYCGPRCTAAADLKRHNKLVHEKMTGYSCSKNIDCEKDQDQDMSGNRNSSEVIKPAVQNFLNWVKAEEEVVQNLPDVPKADEVAECQTVAAKVDDISDEELLLRLYKLKNDDVPKADPDEELLLRLDKLKNDYVPKEMPEP